MWKYEVLVLRLEPGPTGDNHVANIGGKKVIGLENCLNLYGKAGWELVALTPLGMDPQPTSFLGATFKKPGP